MEEWSGDMVGREMEREGGRWGWVSRGYLTLPRQD